jgi:hypothetical protein
MEVIGIDRAGTLSFLNGEGAETTDSEVVVQTEDQLDQPPEESPRPIPIPRPLRRLQRMPRPSTKGRAFSITSPQ